MNIYDVIAMLGGLALFLYGMDMVGVGLEKVAGGRLGEVLEKMTNNVVKSVLVGTVLTAVVHSSAATTIIVIGLVNAGIMKLTSAAGVIMGANIGTTVTSQILRLGDIGSDPNVNMVLRFFTPETLAPLVAVAGVLMFLLGKRNKTKTVGEILLGLGILFTGMFAMQDKAAMLGELESFKVLFQTLTNPILGVIAGAVVTAIIQSSTASVGILQALSVTGVITYGSAIPIIMGQNIGTCIVPIIASVGTNKNARRAALINLYINVVGTAAFLIGIYVLQGVTDWDIWARSINMGGIADFHTVFNIICTVMLMPFTNWLVKLSIMSIRDNPDEQEQLDMGGLEMLEDRLLGSPGLALVQVKKTVLQMAKFAQFNYRESRKLFRKFDTKSVERIKEYEDAIDRMEDKLNDYLLKLNNRELTEEDSRTVTMLLHVLSEYERVGDYSMNLVEGAQTLFERQLELTHDAYREFDTITDAVDEIIEMSITAFSYDDLSIARSVEPLEEVIDVLEDTIKARHMKRFAKGACAVDPGIVFMEGLTDLERIADHCSNIAVYLISHANKVEHINRHEYVKRMHQGDTEEYRQASALYTRKYTL